MRHNPTDTAAGRADHGWRRPTKYAAMLLALLAVVAVPFLLFGETIDGLTQAAMTGTASRAMATAAGFSLLAADVVLPVPSTLVITVLGALLGRVAAHARRRRRAVARLRTGILAGAPVRARLRPARYGR
jgi:hypothetical protein